MAAGCEGRQRSQAEIRFSLRWWSTARAGVVAIVAAVTAGSFLNMRRVLESGEILFAAAILAVGAVVIFVGATYSMGDPADPGPGMFPVALGALLMALGLCIAISGLGAPTTTAKIPLRPLIFVGGAILAWTFLIERFGFLPATIALVGLSAFAERRVRPITVAVLALVLTAGGIALFGYGFGLPFVFFQW